MIIDNTYFIDEIYIPNAKPSVTSNITSVSASILNFISEYERECLIESLGYQLYKEFSDNLDSTKSNGLKVGADAKWDDLLNGKAYTNSDGKAVEWLGVRRKAKSSDTTYSKSFIAQYVYFFYEQNANTTNTGVGHIVEDVKNATVLTSPPKVFKAWNKFVDIVQGKKVSPTYMQGRYGTGVDYFNYEWGISLYKFIQDQNELVKDTYANFTPKLWTRINEFGL